MRYPALPVLLILAFTAPLAAGQELVIPDRQRLQAMSAEELDAYREQMRSRMEEMSPAEQNLMRESGVNGREQMERRTSSSGYGQGYGTRGSQSGGSGGITGSGASGGGQGGYGRGGGRRR